MSPAAQRNVSDKKDFGKDMKDLPESDWKLLRLMKDTLLRRASRTALEQVKQIVIGPDDDPHKVYLELWDTIKTEDGETAPDREPAACDGQHTSAPDAP